MESFKRKGTCKAQRIPVPFIVPAEDSTTGEEQRGNANDWLVEYDGGKKAPVTDEAFQRDWQKCEALVVRIDGPFAPSPHIKGILEIMEEQKRRAQPNFPPYTDDPNIPWDQRPRVFWNAPPGTALGELKVTC